MLNSSWTYIEIYIERKKNLCDELEDNLKQTIATILYASPPKLEADDPQRDNHKTP